MKTPSRRRPSTLFGSPNKTVRSNTGLFTNNVWHCNCNPRLPAPIFQVKKEGPNHGRYFYTCQLDKGRACGFFLWKDNAQVRERDVLVRMDSGESDGRGGSRLSHIEESAQDSRGTRDTTRGRSRTLSPSPTPISRQARSNASKSAVGGTSAKSLEIMRRLAGDDSDSSDGFGSFSLTTQELDEVDSHSSSRKERESRPSRPDAAISMNLLGSPAKRKHDETNDDAFPHDAESTPKKQHNRLKGGMWDGNERTSNSLQTPDNTPKTPHQQNKVSDGLVLPTPQTASSSATIDTPSNPSRHSPSLASDILPRVQAQVSVSTLHDIEEILQRHELRLSGIVRGRDVSRLALRKKDTEIAELKSRIARLEREAELARVMRR